MTLEEYREEFSGAPCDLYDFAGFATEISDCSELLKAGEAYLAAAKHMRKMLQKYDVEQG